MVDETKLTLSFRAKAFFLMIVTLASVGDGSTLYGLTSDVFLQQVQLELINPTNGLLKILGMLSYFPALYDSNAATLDVANGVFYALVTEGSGAETTMVGFSLRNCTVVRSVNLTMFLTGQFANNGAYINLDPTSGHIIASGFNPSQPSEYTWYRVELLPSSSDSFNDPYHYEDANVTFISSITGVTASGDAANALDFVKGISYVVLFISPFPYPIWNLFGVDINSGELVVNISNNASLRVLNYDSVTGNLYGVGTGEDDFAAFYSLPFGSSQFQFISSLSQYLSAYLGVSALDEQNRCLTAMMSSSQSFYDIYMVTVDLSNGTVLSQYLLPVFPMALGYVNAKIF